MTTISAAEAAQMLSTDHVLLERRVRVGKLRRHSDGGFDLKQVEALAALERARDEAWTIAMSEME